MSKLKKKSFTLHVKRDVLFEATIEADSLQEALRIGTEMTPSTIWATPGDIIDDEKTVIAVFES